ncbi:MAG: GAF domain-containing protein [Clostridia bacterium]|nr:GAF domain-containing protein [Clostridia bacterium]
MDYNALCASLRALIAGVPHKIANLANASALIFNTLDDLNWAGFYLLEGDTLVLGPFQGKPACIEIGSGRGVCGAAVREGKTQLVCNVHEFPGHIACDSASNSELVVPIYSNGKTVGVLDLDSPTVGRFTEEDAAGMEEFVLVIEEEMSNQL